MKIFLLVITTAILGHSRILPKELDLSLGLGAGIHYSWLGPHIEARYLVTKQVGLSVAYLATSNSLSTMAWLDFNRWKYGLGPVFRYQLIMGTCSSHCDLSSELLGIDWVAQYDFGEYDGFVVRGGLGILVFENRYGRYAEGTMLFTPNLGFHYQW